MWLNFNRVENTVKHIVPLNKNNWQLLFILNLNLMFTIIQDKTALIEFSLYS